MKKVKKIILVILIVITIVKAYQNNELYNLVNRFLPLDEIIKKENIKIEEIPKYDNKEYIIIKNNEPNFEDKDKTTKSFEKYSNLDYLGRCKSAYANIGIDLMPTEERGNIGMIKPSGWQTIKYDSINGKYLYNRCHLIGYQLTGENSNEKNLITCTRQTNTGIMLKYENKVADYIRTTNNHVLYRVTPIFEEDNLLATGIQMEAYSVEDDGKGIKFNIFIYNVQDGITIDYKNGNSYQNK